MNVNIVRDTAKVAIYSAAVELGSCPLTWEFQSIGSGEAPHYSSFLSTSDSPRMQ
jgi:hypothetical protein